MADSHDNTHLSRLRTLGLPAQAGLLVVVVAAVGLPTGLLAHSIDGALGVIAAGSAGCICLAGGEIALLITAMLARRADPLYRVLVGLLARMLLPLLIALAVQLSVPWLARAGLLFYCLVFYTAVLATETILSVVQVREPSTPGKAT